jgi:hypothetical protein
MAAADKAAAAQTAAESNGGSLGMGLCAWDAGTMPEFIITVSILPETAWNGKRVFGDARPRPGEWKGDSPYEERGRRRSRRKSSTALGSKAMVQEKG